MSKLAVLFAGQGAQKTGMGQSLYDNVAEARGVFDAAESLFPGLRDLCFSGAQEELNRTENTQPCVFTVDMAAYAAFRATGADMRAAAGFSLGEYAALCAAGALSFEDAFRLVVKRARWMRQAAEEQGGGMAAILGKSAAEVEEILSAVRGDGVLEAVNFNCPGQIVAAGDETQLQGLLSYAKENKIRCMRLPVSGAFHSRRMRGVSEKILEEIEGMRFSEPHCALYANRTARPYDMADMKRTLAEQTASPVLFEQIARTLIADGYDTFAEVGPGGALTGFMKRMGGDLKLFHIGDHEGLRQFANEWGDGV